MRIVFMGTPEFAVPTLRALVAAHDVVGVYTRPDAVSGRGGRLRPSPVKSLALQLGLELRQPISLKDDAVVAELRSLTPDVLCVAAYGLILPRAVLDAPPFGALNVHASLLPRWRGAAPIERAILAGDEQTGISIMRMEEGLDTGEYAERVPVETDEYTAQELGSMLAQLGAAALMRTLARVADGTVVWTAQDESLATYAPKLTKPEVALEPRLSADEAARRVRASGPRAPARFFAGGKSITVLRAIGASAGAPFVPDGRLALVPGGVLLGFAEGALELLSVKPEGGREIPATEWARGARLDNDPVWSAP